MNPEFLLAVAAVVTAGVAIYRSFSESKKNIGDAASGVGAGYSQLVNDLQEELAGAKTEIRALREEIRAIREAHDQQVREYKERSARLEANLYQALERISVLEGENELLRGGENGDKW
jgi:chromosome segregation ATPase